MSPDESRSDILLLVCFLVIIMSPRLKVERHIAFGLFLSYYYYYYSSTPVLRLFSQEPLDRSWWNFTETISSMSKCFCNFYIFQNGCRCYGNRKNVPKFQHIFVRLFSQGWLVRSWWNFTGMITVTWIGAWNVDMFQYGCRCHGNDRNIQHSLTSIFSETVKSFLIKLHSNDNHHVSVLLQHIPFPTWPPLPW
jgi:hypothetical protein